jgi:ribosomal protein L7/L12
MEVSTVIGYAVVFFAGLVVGRVWGRASALREGNMLSTRPAAPAVPAQTAAFAPPDAILEEPDAPFEEEVRRLAASGNLINAIKLYRKRKGCGLKEAKDAVERIRG